VAFHGAYGPPNTDVRQVHSSNWRRCAPRKTGLERIFRDVQAARYHPLQEKAQARLAGRLALGLDID